MPEKIRKNPEGWLEQWPQKAEIIFMRLVVVSNRLPFTVSFQEGTPQFKASAGGLTTGLWSYLDRKTLDGAERPDFLWMGWPGASVPPEHEAAVQAYARAAVQVQPGLPAGGEHGPVLPGFLQQDALAAVPLFPDADAVTRRRTGRNTGNVNRVFAEAVVKALRPDDVLWVHDYHLMLLPGLVREKFPDMPIGFFLHIPFPS